MGYRERRNHTKSSVAGGEEITSTLTELLEAERLDDACDCWAVMSQSRRTDRR